MMPIRTVFLLTLPTAALALAGCTSSSTQAPHPADVMIGCYATDAEGFASHRISGGNGRCRYESLMPDAEGDVGFELDSMPRQRLLNLPAELKSQVEVDISDETGIIRVLKFKPDAVFDGEPADSSHYFFAPQVGGPLWQVPCPERSPMAPR